MDIEYYLQAFQKAANKIDKKLLKKYQLEIAVGLYGQSVFLKLYKNSWASPLQDALTAESRIFFSVWVDDAAIQQQKLLYNIHALKLRKLKGYAIESRKFAAAFRRRLKLFESEWPNISVQFGPLTLMQGWIKNDPGDLEKELQALANKFLRITHLVDDTLAAYKV